MNQTKSLTCRPLAFFVCALTHTINLKARPLARLITASNTKHCSFSLLPPLQARNWNHELLHLLGAPERRSSFYSRARKARLDYPALHRKRTRCFSGKSPRSPPITIFKGMAVLQDPFGWHLEVALLLQHRCRLHHQILKNSQSTPVFWTWHQGRVTLTCPPIPLLQSLPHRLFVSALVHPSQVQATSLRHASSLRHSIPRISLQYASSLRHSIPQTPLRYASSSATTFGPAATLLFWANSLPEFSTLSLSLTSGPPNLRHLPHRLSRLLLGPNLQRLLYLTAHRPLLQMGKLWTSRLGHTPLQSPKQCLPNCLRMVEMEADAEVGVEVEVAR